MPAKLRVLMGPDRGREFRLGTDLVRIGTGATAGISLNDPGLQGELVLELRDGAYHLTNGLSYSIYLNRRALLAGQQTVWFDDSILQPTADTQLVLVHDGGTGPAPHSAGAVFEESPIVSKRQVSTSQILAVAGVLVALVILANTRPAVSPGRVVSSKAAMRRISADAITKIDGIVLDPAAAWSRQALLSLRNDLSEARVHEARGERRAALANYLRICTSIASLRQELNYHGGQGSASQVQTDIQVSEVLTIIEPIVNQQIIDLGGS